MFILQGEEAKLVRHVISYVDHETEMQEMCVSNEHKTEMEQILTEKGIEFVSEAVDQTSNEWFNGLEFNSYDEALAVFSKGEQAYLQEKQRQELVDNLRLRADIDYLAAMSEVEI